MTDFSVYVGTPYEDMDCWALATRVCEDLGRPLPSDYHAARRLARAVETAEVGDVAVMKSNSGLHVGVIVGDNLILHTRKGTNAVIERIDSQQFSGLFRLPHSGA